MDTRHTTRAACAVLLATLAGCAQQPKPMEPSAPHYARQPQPAPGAAAAPGQRTSFDSVERYKSDVAEHILRNNPAHTFSGKLPPMLPAIVVLSITVNPTGKVTKVVVQRSRDDDASKVAVASVHRAGTLPRPFNLATGPAPSLTFSETFLFNSDYRFQLRTLAPVQSAD
jgi:protein TonB